MDLRDENGSEKGHIVGAIDRWHTDLRMIKEHLNLII